MQTDSTGCLYTAVGGYAVLNSDATYYVVLFGYNRTCSGSIDGAGSMGDQGTYVVQDTAIVFYPYVGLQWTFHARATGGTSRGPDLDLFRRNWSGYPSVAHLRREPDMAAAACRMKQLNLPSPTEPPGSWSPAAATGLSCPRS